MFNIFFTTLGLSMDSFSAAIACGSQISKKKTPLVLTIPLSLGFSHAFMLFIGWKIGDLFDLYAKSLDHWLAFILLSFIGVKMIKNTGKPASAQKKFFSLFNIFLISLGTSIDALIVGLSFALLDFNILRAVITMGVVSYTLSLLGFLIGEKVHNSFSKKSGVFGGLVMLFLGIKILLEHTLL